MNTNFRFISLVLIFFIGNSCTKSIKVKKNKAAGFVIYGTVIGFKDNTWIYLEDESDHNSIATDSALIYNGKFHFRGTLLQEAVEVQLRTKESEDFRSFWLENSLIRFNATKGSFKNAIISFLVQPMPKR